MVDVIDDGISPIAEIIYTEYTKREYNLTKMVFVFALYFVKEKNIKIYCTDYYSGYNLMHRNFR